MQRIKKENRKKRAKNSTSSSKLLALVLMAVLGPQQTLARPQNPQNPTWLEAGLNGREVQQEIAASTKVPAEQQEGRDSAAPPEQFTEKLEAEYANGMAALKARNWTHAILAFENVLVMDRNFRDTRKRLREAQRGLERESTEMIVARYYADGITAMNDADFSRALAAFEKVRKIDPNYREAASLMAEVERMLQARLPIPAAFASDTPVILPIKVDSLYQLAANAAEQQDWLQAVVNFEKVRLLQPDYRDVTDRLAEVRANLAVGPPTASSGKSAMRRHISTYIGGALALLILPLLGFAMLSPITRARFHLLRGNYLAAAQIYEKLLMHQPNKVKLYPALANLYLLLGRNDETAVKIYKMVLQLNLITRNRDEINTIVAQHYLTEGRTDSDAIEVLENALKTEQRRQQRLS